VIEELRTWPTHHFDESTSVLRFPADSAHCPLVSNGNSTGQVRGVVVWMRPCEGVPFSILFRLTTATANNSQETTSVGWSPADDLFNANTNWQLFSLRLSNERLQQLGREDLDLGNSYAPNTALGPASVSISNFDTDFPPYSVVRHAHIHLSRTLSFNI